MGVYSSSTQLILPALVQYHRSNVYNLKDSSRLKAEHQHPPLKRLVVDRKEGVIVAVRLVWMAGGLPVAYSFGNFMRVSWLTLFIWGGGR